MKQWLIVLLLIFGLFFGCKVYAQSLSPNFTASQLAIYNGTHGQPAYFAYEGKVYDVTKSNLWQEGNHYGLHAGEDLTGKMNGAPHGTEVFAGFPVVGTYGATPVVSTVVTPAAPVSAVWYAQPIRILGLSLLAWTGILLAIFFVLNFATCFALPWSQLPLPWKGRRPGSDPLDSAPTHMRWTMLHKYFAWGTVVIGIVHGVIGFMKLLGYNI